MIGKLDTKDQAIYGMTLSRAEALLPCIPERNA